MGIDGCKCNAEAVIRERSDEFIIFIYGYACLKSKDIGLFFQLHDTRFQNHLGECKGAAVSHGRFGSVHLKNAVVDTEREERGKDMLHGENFRVSPFQRRCAECICHKFALCRHFRGTGKIDTPEDDAAARRSGTHRDCYGNSGMESVSLKGNRFSEGILISFQYRVLSRITYYTNNLLYSDMTASTNIN